MTNSFQYNELCNIHSLIVDFSYEKFGISIENAKANVDYSIALEKSGKYREALSICEAAFDCYKKMVGEEHPEKLITMNSISAIYAMLGKHEESLKLTMKVLNIRKMVLGEEHPNTVRAMVNLYNVYNKLGKNEEALKITKKC